MAHGGGVPEAAVVGLPLLLLAVSFLLERHARRAARAAELDTEPDKQA